jgi:mannose-6-phosphate isomerase
MGAHPGAPARTPDGRSLDDLIGSDPVRLLGPEVVGRFGPRLPFLMKALAAAEPLSLQVHPTAAQARAGFESENAAGIAVGSGTRNYQDASHKPELIYAVTRFEGMAGFRDPARSAEILRRLDVPWATDMAAELVDGPPGQALRRVVTDVLGLRDGDLSEMLAGLTKAARVAEERSHHRRPPSSRQHRDRTHVEREAARLFALTAELAERYPEDPGVLVTLLLNHVVLAPGEAMFLDAGTVHAYTSGFGIEIMASSDNVVRAGLTPKHVDVPELLEVATFTPADPPILAPRRLDEALVQFRPGVDDFTLDIGDAPTNRLPETGPRIVLVLEGRVQVRSRADAVELARGEAVFVGDDEGALEVTGDGRVAVGAVPA